jgi:transcriptional regulator with XRE-family HTH domain
MENMAAMTRSQRLHLARQATEIRHRCLRDGLAPEAIAEVICREVPQMFALEAWRLAHGWSRTEVSARLDSLYVVDGLAAPRISSAELCRWEHGQRRPGDERIEYLCRLYATRPDRLGFGMDYSHAEVGHLARAGITDLWPRSSPETYTDLVERVRSAQEEITVFGLARNFYAKDEILPLFEAKAASIPVTFFVMDPYCDSRRERYRLEPVEAAMENPSRYMREVLRPLYAAAERVAPAAPHRRACESTRTTFPAHSRLRRLTAPAGSCCTGMASEAPKVRSSCSMKARPTGTTSPAS